MLPLTPGPPGAGKTPAESILAMLRVPERRQRAGFRAPTWWPGRAEVRRRIGLSGQFAAVDQHLTPFRKPRHDRPTISLGPAPRRAAPLLRLYDPADTGVRPVKTYFRRYAASL